MSFMGNSEKDVEDSDSNFHQSNSTATLMMFLILMEPWNCQLDKRAECFL
jgi:hypothetical protein